LFINPSVNPETLDEQYFKDFKIYDKDKYLIADGSREPPTPNKMIRYISFKNVEIEAVGTKEDYTKFNITIDIIP